jgi:hypothetical protein
MTRVIIASPHGTIAFMARRLESGAEAIVITAPVQEQCTHRFPSGVQCWMRPASADRCPLHELDSVPLAPKWSRTRP